MSRLAPQALIGLLGIICAASLNADGTKDHGEAHLREFVAKLQSLKADFRQELHGSDGKLIEESRGHLLLSRPGRFRWDYVTPHERVVAADGVHVWLYEADLQQVTERAFERTIGNTPAALLTGEGDIDEQFEFVGSTRRDKTEWVQLRPRSAEADFSLIAVGFAGDRLTGLELDDRLGQHTRITLTDVELNRPVELRQFQFKAPPGVDVIREDEL